jgi:MFS family permease
MSEENSPVKTISAILLAVLLMGIGSALLATAVSIRAGLEGVSEQLLGFIMSGYYIGLILGTFLSGRFIRSVGYVRSFAAFASIASIAGFLHVLVVSPAVWFFLRVMVGVCLAVMEVVVESWLNVTSVKTNRGRILSLYSIVLLASMGLGQPLIGRFSPSSFEVFVISAIIISLCLIPVTLAKVSGTARVSKSRPQITKTFLRSPLAGIGVVVSGFLYGSTWSLIPRYGQQVGLSEARIGLVMLLIALGTLTFQWPLGVMSDRKGRLPAIFVSLCVTVGSSIFIAVTGTGGPLFYIVSFIFGGFGMPLYSLSVALINDQLRTDEMVQAAGTIILFYGIGSVAGPVLSGALMSRIGPSGLYYAMAVPTVLYLFFALSRIRKAVRKPGRERATYKPYPRTTAAIFSLLKKSRKKKNAPDSK